MALERMDYGPTLDAGDFGLKALGCASGCDFGFGGPDSINGPVDVLAYLQADWAERATHGYHSQYRLRFANNKPIKGDDGHGVYDNYRKYTLTIEFLVP